MRMKFLNNCLLCLLALLASCSAPKEVLYLQDITSLKEETIDKNYEVIIHKDDLLAILVNSKDPELALPFNMPLISFQIDLPLSQVRWQMPSTYNRLQGLSNGDLSYNIFSRPRART